MNFSEALELLKEGNSLYRKQWKAPQLYEYMKICIIDDIIWQKIKLIGDNDELKSMRSFSQDEILADDWEIVDE